MRSGDTRADAIDTEIGADPSLVLPALFFSIFALWRGDPPDKCPLDGEGRGAENLDLARVGKENLPGPKH